MAPLPAAPSLPPATPTAVTAPGSATPAPLDTPPDIGGLNFPEVAVPGADLSSSAPDLSPAAAPNATSTDYVGEITAHRLQMPIDNIKAAQLSDTFNDARTGSKHEAIDIMAPAGTPIHAIDEGNIVKLFTSKKGGLTVYQFDNARKYCYYYAHLSRYAPNIKEGMLVRPGNLIGYVGSTGDANTAAPHLHFAISLLDADKKYWKGTELNPYPVLMKIAGQGQ